MVFRPSSVLRRPARTLNTFFSVIRDVIGFDGRRLRVGRIEEGRSSAVRTAKTRRILAVAETNSPLSVSDAGTGRPLPVTCGQLAD
jgi:hypothetical protein